LQLIGETILDEEPINVLSLMPNDEGNRASRVTAGERAVLDIACSTNDDYARITVLVIIKCAIQFTIAEMAMVHEREWRLLMGKNDRITLASAPFAEADYTPSFLPDIRVFIHDGSPVSRGSAHICEITVDYLRSLTAWALKHIKGCRENIAHLAGVHC
jgi:hypothetical protein